MLRDCRCGGFWREESRTGEQSSGYSFGKGLIGAAVFGPVGAVAGIGGKKTHTTIYRCSGCGRKASITYDSHGKEIKCDYMF